MPPPRKYRQQVTVVEALQYDETNKQQIIDWAAGRVTETLEGGIQLEMPGGFQQPINLTDWVLIDPWKHWFVMPDEMFAITYEAGESPVQ